jgi:hypothetical protein
MAKIRHEPRLALAPHGNGGGCRHGQAFRPSEQAADRCLQGLADGAAAGRTRPARQRDGQGTSLRRRERPPIGEINSTEIVGHLFNSIVACTACGSASRRFTAPISSYKMNNTDIFDLYGR